MAKKKKVENTVQVKQFSESYQFIELMRYLALECTATDDFDKSIIELAKNLVDGCYIYILPFPIIVHAMFDEFDIYIDVKTERFKKTSIFAPAPEDTELTWRNRIRHMKNLSAYLNAFTGKRLGHIPLNWSIQHAEHLMHLWFLWADSNFRMNGELRPDWIIPHHLLLKWSYGR